MRLTLRLIRLLAWRGLAADPARSLVTLLGVALGVAVFLAIRLANQAILASFEQSLEQVAGRSQLEVHAGEPGLDETLFPVIAAAAGVEAAAPLLQAITPVSGRPGEALLVLGVDVLGDAVVREYRGPTAEVAEPLRLLTDPDAILVTARYAQARGLAVGDAILLVTPTGPRPFVVRGLLGAAGVGGGMEGQVAVLDIAAAQVAFGKLGRLDRVDLVLEPGADPDRVAARLRRDLPPGVAVRRPEARGAQVEEMLAAFQLNLTVLSLIALFVGMFLVYNTLAVAVVRRRRQLAVLRSLGLSRARLLCLIAGEGAALGLVGSLAGILLGVGLARATLAAMSQTVSALYAFVRPAGVEPSGLLLGEAILLGTAVAVVSALFPALEAAAVTPREGLAPALLERAYRPWRMAVAGLCLLALAGLLARAGPVGGRPLFGYGAALSLLLGAAFLAPGGLAAFQRLLRRPLGRMGGLAGGLAARNLGRGLRRNGVSVAAMAVSLAMLVSVSIMVQSFRGTVEVWIHQTLQADLYLSPVGRLIRGADARMSREILDRVRGVPGVAEAGGLRSVRLEDGGGGTLLFGGSDFDLLARRGRLLFRRGESAALLAEAKQSGGLVVTEVLATRYGIREGDELPIPTPQGPRRLRVVGVYYDYATEGGMAVADTELFERLWGDRWLSSVVIYLAPGAEAAAVRAGILQRLGSPGDFLLLTNRALRGRVLEIFDQTFAITYALEIIALVVAALGVFNTLLAGVLERTREIGILRALGFDRPGILRTILWEAAFLGLVAIGLGLLAGLGLSWILIHVINRQSFGWTIQFAVPIRLLVEYGLLALAASLLAGWSPAWKASRLPVAEAVRYE